MDVQSSLLFASLNSFGISAQKLYSKIIS
jgi:hypothetical protein